MVNLPGAPNKTAEIRHQGWLDIVAALVLLSGLLTISSVLLTVLRAHHSNIAMSDAHFTLLAGLSLIYLASLLRRGKYNAWLVAVPLYGFLVVRDVRHFIFDIPEDVRLLVAILNLAIPVVAFLGLLIFRHQYNVRSEIRSFTTALRRSALVLAVALVYGTVGFQLLDERDFYQDIAPLTGLHYTLDQFGLTTSKQLTPHTKRAKLFLDSLGVLSTGSVFYVVISLFAPIRFRLSHSGQDFEDIRGLLRKYPSTSEDFFKLWPRDKAYFFTPGRNAGLAYKAVAGMALVVGDPAGKPRDFADLLARFEEFCRLNDWQPALIHTDKTNLGLYRRLGFELQKIGEEAIVDIGHFVKNVMSSKDFRHIANKFSRQNYQVQMLAPPHSPAVLKRLREVSNDWLQAPGRAERGFMMGYFSDDYMQQCPVMAARDETGAIQAFVNQVPNFNPAEANFDFLRHTSSSPGNINDYLMIEFISHLHAEGTERLNMGLAPLAGLEAKASGAKDRGAIDALMSLVYVTGNRFYSFKGLKRFKSKYEPQWEDRYIVYRGGLRGFGGAMNALLRAMRVPRRHYFSKYKNV